MLLFTARKLTVHRDNNSGFPEFMIFLNFILIQLHTQTRLFRHLNTAVYILMFSVSNNVIDNMMIVTIYSRRSDPFGLLRRLGVVRIAVAGKVVFL